MIARGARSLRQALGLAVLLAAGPLASAGSGPAAVPEAKAPATLQVLHWWSSASEREAARVLAEQMAQEGLVWRDAVIPGGAGIGAGKVLRGRVLAGDAPEVTQMVGVGIAEAAAMGLLLQLDDVAREGRWTRALFPTVDEGIRHRQRVVAAPLGIHRVNQLFVNRRVFERLGLAPPRSWAEFEQVAPRLKAAGVVPLAQSAEAWQVATLFESLVLAEGGAALHRALFVAHGLPAVDDPRLAAALQRLRALKPHMWLAGTSPAIPEQPWTRTLDRLVRGEAAMMVMGDWVKGELMQAGWLPGRDFECLAAPGTEGVHLYSVDSFTFFAQDYARAAAQQQLARLVMTPALQVRYNEAKGSVTVRRDADPARMDRCARQSWTDFGKGAASLAPSLVHRMATDEASKDAIVAELHRYFSDDQVTPAAVQRRLGAIFRVLHPRAAGAPR